MRNVSNILCLLWSLFLAAEAQFDGNSEMGWLIIGGSFAQNHEFPWMVRIYSDIPNAETLACGAALVHSQWIITAGHCVYDGRNIASSVRAYLGKYDLSIFREPGEEFRVSGAADIHLHPLFHSAANTNYDFALIRLKTQIQVNSTSPIKPIDLPDVYSDCDSNYNDDLTVVDTCSDAVAPGWGRPGPSDYLSFILKKVSLTIQPFKLCTKTFQNDYFTKAKLCARGGPGQQTCRGDSGGPLICYRNWDRHPFLLGITSYGNINCNETNGMKPAVYSRLCMAVPWIRKTIDGWYPKIDENRQSVTQYQIVPLLVTDAPVVPGRRGRIVSKPSTVPTASPIPDPGFVDSRFDPGSPVENDEDEYPPAMAPVKNGNNQPTPAKNAFFFYPSNGANCTDPNYVILQLQASDPACDVTKIDGEIKLEAFFNAIRASFVDVVRRLVDEFGVDANSVESYPDYGYSQPALILAARWGRLEIVEILLNRGARINVRDSLYAKTAANWAACDGKAEIYEYLVKRGAQMADCKCGRDTCASYLENVPHVAASNLANSRNLIQRGAVVTSTSTSAPVFEPMLTAAPVIIANGANQILHNFYVPASVFLVHLTTMLPL